MIKSMKKILVLSIAFLFIGIGTLTVTGENIVEKRTTFENMKANIQIVSNKGSPIPFFRGTMGNNNWYISEVQISFQYSPSDVTSINYRIGDDWINYTGPFNVSEDGGHLIPWFWVDKNGTRWNEPALEFKIDKTAPSIVIKKQIVSKTQLKFTATTADATSGLEKVEFYLDGELQTTLTKAPYEWTWEVDGIIHQVQAFAYDNAGLQKDSNILDTKSRTRQYQVNQFLLYILEIFFKNRSLY